MHLCVELRITYGVYFESSQIPFLIEFRVIVCLNCLKPARFFRLLKAKVAVAEVLQNFRREGQKYRVIRSSLVGVRFTRGIRDTSCLLLMRARARVKYERARRFMREEERATANQRSEYSVYECKMRESVDDRGSGGVYAGKKFIVTSCLVRLVFNKPDVFPTLSNLRSDSGTREICISDNVSYALLTSSPLSLSHLFHALFSSLYLLAPSLYARSRAARFETHLECDTR